MIFIDDCGICIWYSECVAICFGWQGFAGMDGGVAGVSVLKGAAEV